MLRPKSDHTRIVALLRDIAGLQAGPGTSREKSVLLLEAGRELQEYIEREEQGLREGQEALAPRRLTVHKVTA